MRYSLVYLFLGFGIIPSRYNREHKANWKAQFDETLNALRCFPEIENLLGSHVGIAPEHTSYIRDLVPSRYNQHAKADWKAQFDEILNALRCFPEIDELQGKRVGVTDDYTSYLRGLVPSRYNRDHKANWKAQFDTLLDEIKREAL